MGSPAQNSPRSGRPIIRRVVDTEADVLLPQLRSLARRSKASWGYDARFLEEFEALLPRELVRAGRVTLVAQDEGVVVGFCVVDDRADRAWLEDLWVEPAFFGRGVGRQLFQGAADAARQMGRTKLEFESDPNAEAFYARLGAVRIDLVASSLGANRRLPQMRLAL